MLTLHRPLPWLLGCALVLVLTACGTSTPANIEPVKAAPTIDRFTATPSVLVVTGATTFTWDVFDQDSESLSCSIDLGDGSETVFIDDCAAGAELTHAFSSTGTFTVRLTVSDGELSADGELEITVVTWAERAKLLAEDAGTNDWFGFSVSIDGDTVVVGAYLDDSKDEDGLVSWSGAAYVFVRDGASWIQQARLTAADPSTNDQFGYSVDVQGDTVIVGSRLDDDTMSNTGSAYVFVRDGETWSQQAKLTAGDAAVDSEFGYAVSVSGETAVIGAYLDDHNCSGVPNCDSGSAYVFVRDGATWSQQAKLVPSDSAAGDRFASSVAISGETVVVGSRLDDDAGSNSGSAYVFVRDGETWSQQAKLTPDDASQGSEFGFSVAVDADTIVTGSRLDAQNGDGAGSAYVFVRDGETWSQQAKLIAGDAEARDEFGYAVSVEGDTAVIGAPFDDDGGFNAGAAYLFVRSGSSWSELVKLTAGDASDGERFGATVSNYGNAVVIGAYLDDDGGSNTGSSYLFENSP